MDDSEEKEVAGSSYGVLEVQMQQEPTSMKGQGTRDIRCDARDWRVSTQIDK